LIITSPLFVQNIFVGASPKSAGEAILLLFSTPFFYDGDDLQRF